MSEVNFKSFLRSGDALIIVPPFAGLDRPSLGAHVLQACARKAGFRVSVLYASLALAEDVGELQYEAICYAPTTGLIGERFFAATAYGVPSLGRGVYLTEEHFEGEMTEPMMNADELLRLESGAGEWADQLALAVCDFDFKVIGCTTTFEQTAASVAVLERIKRLRPDAITVIGGANCEGAMAEGILSLAPNIDYVFSGECEEAFPLFLKRVLDGDLPPQRVITGTPCFDLDSLPAPDFSEFYEQLDHYLPESQIKESGNIWLPFESSRGCWWGEKHHCTFCGINGSTLKFREKSPDKVIGELKTQLSTHPSNKVCMVDNIMPHTYFRTLIPRLAEEVPGLHVFYEQKANLSLSQVVSLKESGVALIQPGIEALSTPLLKLMDKGVTARQNIALLRYARAAGLSVNWNLLYAFPGDQAEYYEETLALLPLMRHFNPPDGPCHLSVDRFSPYFFAPERYGVTNLRPMESYLSVLPESADVEKVAYHFIGDYASGSVEHPEIIEQISRELDAWRSMWIGDNPSPVLELTPLSDSNYLLIDTRGLEQCDEFNFLSYEEAKLVLTGARIGSGTDAQWAVERKLVVELDSWHVPLVTCKPDLLAKFESDVRATHLAQPPASLPVIQLGSP